MEKTTLVYDERYLLHTTGENHPESPMRIQAIYERLLESNLLDEIKVVPATPANQRWIETVHSIHYIMRFEEASISGFPDFDHSDNCICRDSYDIAVLAVGGVLAGIDAVMKKESSNSFCAIRPPGHHAEIDKSMGFCYFNNIAIGAKYLQKEYGLERIGIIDFDVHHGNGTQHIFDADPSVYYYSIHEHPSFAYPGTGREFEEGLGEGSGFTLNSPVLPGRGDEEYKKLVERDLVPAMTKFQPDFLLVSAGFDAHITDLMSAVEVSSEGYDFLSKTVVDLAHNLCQDRLVSVLEGGYNLEVLPVLVENHLKILMEI